MDSSCARSLVMDSIVTEMNQVFQRISSILKYILTLFVCPELLSAICPSYGNRNTQNRSTEVGLVSRVFLKENKMFLVSGVSITFNSQAACKKFKNNKIKVTIFPQNSD